jgi:hypothetical protein
MRGFDIVVNLPEKITTAGGTDRLRWPRMLPQRRCTGNGAQLYFGNRALVLIVLRMDVAVWDARGCSPLVTGTF